jgi:RNA polymerase sigma factor (sigma-70 family)
MREVEDANLIQNILTGDTEAETVLYEKYRVILTNYLLKKYPCNYDIEDDVSEILIKIFLNLSTYDSDISKFKTWAFAIANNHMIDKSRSTYYINSTGTTHIGDNLTFINDTYTSDCTTINGDVPCSFTTSNATLQLEQNSSVNFVSDQIESCDFQFLNMHYTMGYSYCEIGTEFNLSSNTISNRVNYIKGKLKDSIDYEMIFE